jgi:hypothetical protein
MLLSNRFFGVGLCNALRVLRPLSVCVRPRALIGGIGDGLGDARCYDTLPWRKNMKSAQLIRTVLIFLVLSFLNHTLFRHVFVMSSIHSRELSLRYNELGERMSGIMGGWCIVPSTWTSFSTNILSFLSEYTR